MEKPVSLSADDIRDEKVKVLRSLQVVEKGDVIIGQHTAANGTPGYLDDEGVPDDSTTPTFAAVCLHIDNDRYRYFRNLGSYNSSKFWPNQCASAIGM